MTSYQYVGKRARAEDGVEKVTGKARYVGDYTLPGMLVAKVLRSTVPHARIVSLDVAPALKVPGVLAVVTAEDFVNHGNWGWPIKDAYAIAWRKVRYVGDPIAAVAASGRRLRFMARSFPGPASRHCGGGTVPPPSAIAGQGSG